MADDNKSVASATSASNEKIECPHCNKEFQSRAIFNHIRSKHLRELIDSTLTKWCGEAIQGKALKLVWWKKNDFDEEEDVTIYACLATNKTFTTEQRANTHFKKNPEHLNDHITQMKKLNKEILAAKKAPKLSETDKKLLAAVKANDPELARALWRAVLFHVRGCQKIITEVEKKYSPEQISTYVMRSPSQFFKTYPTLDKWINAIKVTIASVEALQAEQCLDVATLEWWKIRLDQFTFTALPLLVAAGDIFDWMFMVSHDECIRPKDLVAEELFGQSAQSWPGVDF